MVKVSVLIPYYNDKRFLQQAIESVLAQTFADFELVLVNHASTDGSRAIARSFGDPRIIHVDMPVNYGAGGGLVVALRYLSCDKRATWAYQYVHDCLQDPVRREAAESRMGITVAGFRDLVRSLTDASRPRGMWVRFRDRWLRRKPRQRDAFGGYSL